jgi:hypothetical protein
LIELIDNVDKLHTTDLGIKKISNHLNISGDVVDFCKRMVLDINSKIYIHGKNYYCENGNIRLTINKRSYTIITAHML